MDCRSHNRILLLCCVFLQAKEQYVQHLEQQIASLKAVSGQLDAATRKQRSRQPLYISLQVCVGMVKL